MKKVTPGDIDTALARFLFHYRTTPHSTTGVSPAELLLGCQLRTHNTLLQPQPHNHVRNALYRQKSVHDVHAKEQTFHIGDPVFVKNFSNQGTNWLPEKRLPRPREHSPLLSALTRDTPTHWPYLSPTIPDQVQYPSGDYDFLTSSQPVRPPLIWRA